MCRALEDGPWMFGKDLVVMIDLDETKSNEEMEFTSIPIWVRVRKLPFGMMNKAVGEAIGSEIGSFISMDLDEDGTTLGRYLRIKVRLDIRKPLMRGVTVFLGEKEDKPAWCPVEYEFLPDFCYTCGLIGHIDKNCDIKLAHGEIQQYTKYLRCLPNKGKVGDGVAGQVVAGLTRCGGLEGEVAAVFRVDQVTGTYLGGEVVMHPHGGRMWC